MVWPKRRNEFSSQYIMKLKYIIDYNNGMLGVDRPTKYWLG